MVIRKMREADRAAVIDMMRVFYASPAVLSDGSEEIFRSDVDACLGGGPYAEGFVFVEGERLVGYGMIAKSYSTEFGKPCVWIEDIYVVPEYRGRGAGTAFIRLVRETFRDAVIRIEAERENAAAVATYVKNGFAELPYMELMLRQ